MIAWLKARWAEPSSHAALAGLLQVAKTVAPQYALVFDGLSLLFGVQGVMRSESGNAQSGPPR